jgi:hypothetical protein
MAVGALNLHLGHDSELGAGILVSHICICKFREDFQATPNASVTAHYGTLSEDYPMEGSMKNFV